MILIFHTYMDLGLDKTCFFNDQLINHHQFSSNFIIIVLHLRLFLFLFLFLFFFLKLNVSINLVFVAGTNHETKKKLLIIVFYWFDT